MFYILCFQISGQAHKKHGHEDFEAQTAFVIAFDNEALTQKSAELRHSCLETELCF